MKTVEKGDKTRLAREEFETDPTMTSRQLIQQVGKTHGIKIHVSTADRVRQEYNKRRKGHLNRVFGSANGIEKKDVMVLPIGSVVEKVSPTLSGVVPLLKELKGLTEKMGGKEAVKEILDLLF